MAEAYLVGGVRTPVGRYGGALASVRPDDLAALVVGELVRRTDLDRAGELGAIDEVILGAANQAGAWTLFGPSPTPTPAPTEG